MKEIAPYLSLIILIVGGLIYVLTKPDPPIKARIGELGKWAFIVGLAAFLFIR